MSKAVISFLFLIFTFGVGAYLIGPVVDKGGRPCVSQVAQVQALFPATKKEIEQLVATTKQKVAQDLAKIYSSAQGTQTFNNTFMLLDRAVEHCKIAQAGLYVMSISGQEEKLQMAAQEGLSHLQKFFIDELSLNTKLYQACVRYVDQLSTQKHEQLSEERLYFINEVMRDFKRIGLELPREKQERVRAIQKERTDLALAYEAVYTSSCQCLNVPIESLAGLDQSFISSLARSDGGLYCVPTSYDKFFIVMDQCSVASTRQKLYEIFMNRGYPQNVSNLKKYISLSDELAHLLGYESYAHYSLEEQMAKTPEVVKEFLTTLHTRSLTKALDEIKVVTQQLPDGVVCVGGKLQPWDLTYVFGAYKKKHFKIDETVISSYFPLEHTLESLLKLYEDFFGVCFKKLSGVGFWHKAVQSFAVYKKGKYLGMLILDIHPRTNKFSHAGQVTVVPAVLNESGEPLPAVVVVFANFTEGSPDKPAVLSRHEVKILFHECGHALHGLLGATECASLSGTATKGGFVEMPSQMLEEWMWDPEILRTISSHGTTHEPLPADMIKNIISLKHFEVGDTILRQIFLSEVSLAYYLPGRHKDVAGLWKSLHEKWRPSLVFDKSNRGFCSFPHIMGYGPRYYGYLWSRVFALDLFSAIKPYGLRNPQTGARFVDMILAKGGSKDPNALLASFLGRPCSANAFFQDCGL